MFKYYKSQLPNIFNDMFVKQCNVHIQNTRNNLFYRIPLCKTERKKNSICYHGAYLWNEHILKKILMLMHLIQFQYLKRFLNTKC